MRQAAAILFLVLLSGGPGYANEPEIPIEVERGRSKVTPEHLTYIRTWLHENLHERDLLGIDVSIANRMHPGTDYRALACLARHDTDTYRVRRVISFAHRSWVSFRDGAYAPGEDWCVEDEYQVTPLFRFGEVRKAIDYDSSLSYDTVRTLLRAIYESRIELPRGEKAERRPRLADVDWIHVDEGRIRVTTSTGRFSGLLHTCERRDGRWVVLEICEWVS